MTPNPDVDDDDRKDLEALATEITERVEIRLEHEAHYDWVAFVPQGESDAGALMKYSVKVAGEDEFKSEASKPGNARPRRSSRTFSGTVSTDSMPRSPQTRYSDVSNEQSRNCTQVL